MNTRQIAAAIGLVLSLALPTHLAGQVSSFDSGDGVLNAPYRGTIDSLREATMEYGYGEVKNHVEPLSGTISDIGIQVWADNAHWDRSVLRLFEGIDCSGQELDLTNGQVQTVNRLPGHTFKRFSFKAVGTKNLQPQEFTIYFSYDGDSHSRTIRVGPTEMYRAGFGMEEQPFLYGTPLLEVSIGAAELVVPVGRTASMIGAACAYTDVALGISNMKSSDALLPGMAETLLMQNYSNFHMTDSSSGYYKVEYGTPWIGHLFGFYESGSVYGLDGVQYDITTGNSDDAYHVDYIRPKTQGRNHPATLRLQRTGDYVNTISDGASNPNTITLTRVGGDVTRITTSDGRGWDIQSDPVDGWITGIEPDGVVGSRYFEYEGSRLSKVKNSSGTTLREFVYDSGEPTYLVEEKKRIEGNLEAVILHESTAGDQTRTRKDYVASGLFRLTSFVYDGAGFENRLVSVTNHDEYSGQGTSYTRQLQYQDDTVDTDGTMQVAAVLLPDGRTIHYEYDAHTLESIDDSLHCGLLSKVEVEDPSGGRTPLYDIELETLWHNTHETPSTYDLLPAPRVVKSRDGRGGISEVTYEYDLFDEYVGSRLNLLMAANGPVTSLGYSGEREPREEFEHWDTEENDWSFVLRKVISHYASESTTRTLHYRYDELLRLERAIKDEDDGQGDPELDLETVYLYCDDQSHQSRATIDPEGYCTRTTYDDEGRIAQTTAYLYPDVCSSTMPCTEPSSLSYYRTSYEYDQDGYLVRVVSDNKDDDGNPLVPATITTHFDRDSLGRVTKVTEDEGGIEKETNYVYDWQGQLVEVTDTSGRGYAREYDGRGLLTSVTPIDENGIEDSNLKVEYSYNSVGALESKTFPAAAGETSGPKEEYVYDGFGRVHYVDRIPATGSDDPTTRTTFTYDAASNIVRALIEQVDGIGPDEQLADYTFSYDEGGFNYETRQRAIIGVDTPNSDVVVERKYDWAGNVTEVRRKGDGGITVGDSFQTFAYDGASRLSSIIDSEGGEVVYTRDGRGNPTEISTKLTSSVDALTNIAYDALGRPVEITAPEDHLGDRAVRLLSHDSRNNLRKEIVENASGLALYQALFDYDNLSRPTRQVLLEDPTVSIAPGNADVTEDRVVDVAFDADGRVQSIGSYNNAVSATLATTVTHDDLGRRLRVTDPSGAYTENVYAADNGLLAGRTVNDVLGTRSIDLDRDGHRRVASVTRQGLVPEGDLTTAFELDGLGRPVRTTDPRGITTSTAFDPLGRLTSMIENVDGLALERETSFAYNPLGQLLSRTTQNKDSEGTALDSQETAYRYDTLGRLEITVYPDSADLSDPDNCTDCVQMEYDLAGRLTSQTDQRGITTAFTYDDRGLPITRTAGSQQDAYEFDALGRLIGADRGTPSQPTSVSQSTFAYTGLGDLSSEALAIAGGTPRVVGYSHDQVGNRLQMTYPGGEVLGYTPTALNQVASMAMTSPSLDVEYDFQGPWLEQRSVGTTATDTWYTQETSYDQHRRISGLTNSLVSGASTTTVSDYLFDYDEAGNLLGQFALDGLDEFKGDDRGFEIDDLGRLIATTYYETGAVESSTFDLVGNRESHIDRSGELTEYALANAANEYSTVGGDTITYDASGNLIEDEDGRQYSYDAQHRLIEVLDASSAVLASYDYDALGRRIASRIGGVQTRYYYDGQSVIEERSATDTRQAFHVNGGQFIDERVATYEDGRGAFDYYLLNRDHSIAATADASGNSIERVDFSAAGSFVDAPRDYFFDADEDLDIDLEDFDSFSSCLSGPDGVPAANCQVHDFDRDGDVDTYDFAFLQQLLSGNGVQPIYAARRDATFYHDADGDRDVDIDDYVSFSDCANASDPDAACLSMHDFDVSGTSDGSVTALSDYMGFTLCQCDSGDIAPEFCLRSAFEGSVPESGTFTLHGRPVDVLPDGKVLTFVRARFYDPQKGRWLQRDPKGNVDGPNLYEAFKGNATRHRDPTGTTTAMQFMSSTIAGIEAFGRFERRYPEWYKQDHYFGELRTYILMQDLCGHGPRFVDVGFGVADFETDTVSFPSLSDDEVNLFNDIARERQRRWEQTGYLSPSFTLASSATVSQEGYLAWCDVASILLSPVPLVPLDFVVDQSAMTLRAHRHELADDPVSSWLYANPGKHFLLRTLPDVIPYASAAASLRPALPKVRVSLPRLNFSNYRLVLDPSTVGMNAGNLRVKYVGAKGGRSTSLSPPGAGRRGAFREAKRNSGVPVSQEPSRVLKNFDRRGNVQPGRIYEFDVPAEGGGIRTVRIREDAGGHYYGPGDPQNRGRHFNDPLGNHYDY